MNEWIYTHVETSLGMSDIPSPSVSLKQIFCWFKINGYKIWPQFCLIHVSLWKPLKIFVCIMYHVIQSLPIVHVIFS